jgi:hypothetical protein
MPHQTPDSSKATAQNAVTDNGLPNDQARGQARTAHPEPRSYAAGNVADSSLALPAAGEVSDYMDEGAALGAEGLQQGRNHTMRPNRTEAERGQGRRTRQANRKRLKGGEG